MSGFVISSGTVVSGDRVEKTDIAIDDGVITEVGTDIRQDGREVFDATDCWVGPGFVDLHTHLREPGEEWKETIESGRAAAAAGGYTAVVAMPNTDPPIDIGYVARQVRRSDGVRVIPSGAITMGRSGERLAHLDELWDAGVAVFSDDGDTVADGGVLRRAMEYIGQLGGVVAQHAEDPGLCAGGHMHEGSVSSRLGMVGLPAVGEEVVVARDLKLVEVTGCRYHVQHVSTAGTVELVEAAKRNGLPVTAEVAPHHLVLDHREVASMDPVYKMYPPLRTPDDVAAVVEGLTSGVIDCVATDHAPHAAFEKDVPFEDAPRGVVGLETAASVVNMALDFGPTDFFDRMSDAPRRILGETTVGVEVGSRADLVVFRPEGHWEVESLHSRSHNSPWLGAELEGVVEATMVGDQMLWRRQ
ncbi:MAG: amidohydrolase family protein [Acidimicrobiia bacterium]|nr:amidohydrolase family protein [Acidimicrobiia bacterium]